MSDIDRLIERMSEEADSSSDIALWRLLIAFQKHLPPLDEYFHKSFRQTDVIDVDGCGGHVDMAIHTLISESELFWKLFPNPAKEEFAEEKESDSDD